MVFWLTLVILIVGIAVSVWTENSYDNFVVEIVGFSTYIIAGVIWLGMILAIICGHCGIDAKVEMWKEQYNTIAYKVESGVCRDEFGLLNKEVIDEIQDWNTDLRYKQNIQDDFWIGIFEPNIYDQFEYIDYTDYARE